MGSRTRRIFQITEAQEHYGADSRQAAHRFAVVRPRVDSEGRQRGVVQSGSFQVQDDSKFVVRHVKGQSPLRHRLLIFRRVQIHQFLCTRPWKQVDPHCGGFAVFNHLYGVYHSNQHRRYLQTAFALAGWNVRHDDYAATVAIKSICRNDIMCEVPTPTDNGLIVIMCTEAFNLRRQDRRWCFLFRMTCFVTTSHGFLALQ